MMYELIVLNNLKCQNDHNNDINPHINIELISRQKPIQSSHKVHLLHSFLFFLLFVEGNMKVLSGKNFSMS